MRAVGGVVAVLLGLALLLRVDPIKPIKRYDLPPGYQILDEKSPIGSELYEYFRYSSYPPTKRGVLVQHSHPPTKSFNEGHSVVTFRSTTGHLVEWPDSAMYRTGTFLVKE